MYVRYNHAINSTDLATIRLRRGRAKPTVPGDHFGMDGYLRIGYGDEPTIRARSRPRPRAADVDHLADPAVPDLLYLPCPHPGLRGPCLPPPGVAALTVAGDVGDNQLLPMPPLDGNRADFDARCWGPYQHDAARRQRRPWPLVAEQPGKATTMLGVGSAKPRASAYFLSINRNKESVTLDFCYSLKAVRCSMR